MKPFRSLSAVEQLAAHLREEIRSGGLDGDMPGVAQLVRRLEVGTSTVVAALDILKREGILEAHGERKRSRIVTVDHGTKAGLRIRILLYEESDAHIEYVVQLAFRLEERGHHVTYAAKTLKGLKFDVKRVARMVENDDGEAWVIMGGSRPVLEWFCTCPVPAFAMFGRRGNLQMAGLSTSKLPAAVEILRRLVDLGHRRIVMMSREEGRKPIPSTFEQGFLDELERLGIRTGAYNLPDWEDNARGLHRCLDSLFRHTPPTALILDQPDFFFATLQHLSSKGLAAPRDISVVALEDHPAYAWFEPKVSLIRTETRQWVPRVLQWVENVANGTEDRRQTIIRGEFIEGGTIGPVPAK